jgi:hypothetical protein
MNHALSGWGSGSLSDEGLRVVGLTRGEEGLLIRMNDRGDSFAAIADHIEEFL